MLTAVFVVLTPVLLVIAVAVLWEQGQRLRVLFTQQIEALRKSHARHTNVAVAVLGQKIQDLDVQQRGPASVGRVRPAELFRGASRAVHSLAKSAALGLENSPEADAVRAEACSVLTRITANEAASLLTVIVARADRSTLEWLANELADAADREQAT